MLKVWMLRVLALAFSCCSLYEGRLTTREITANHRLVDETLDVLIKLVVKRHKRQSNSFTEHENELLKIMTEYRVYVETECSTKSGNCQSKTLEGYRSTISTIFQKIKSSGGITSGFFNAFKEKYDEAKQSFEAAKQAHIGVDGGWSEWGSCKGLRKRNCVNPAPKNGGAYCFGNSSVECSINNITCDAESNPTDGGWSDWSSFGGCSATCGIASKTRRRTCSNPKPRNGGKSCQGIKEETKSCDLDLCFSDCSTGETFLLSNTRGMVITSPNYTGNYPDKSNCKWIFLAPPGEKVSFTILDIETEFGYDVIKIYDDIEGEEDKAPILATMSGTDLQEAVISSREKMRVTFISDENINRNGFKATLKTLKKIDLPIFDWIDLFTLNITFPNKANEIIKLTLAPKLKRACIFQGKSNGTSIIIKSPFSSDGCRSLDQYIEIVLISNNLEKKTGIYSLKNGQLKQIDETIFTENTINTRNNSLSRNIEVPDLIRIKVQFAYDKGLFNKFQKYDRGKPYIKKRVEEMFYHSKWSLRGILRGANIELMLEKEILFINEMLSMNNSGLYIARKYQLHEEIPIIILLEDNGNNVKGLSFRSGACRKDKGRYGVALVAWRDDGSLAGEVLTHEMGHLIGGFHVEGHNSSETHHHHDDEYHDDKHEYETEVGHTEFNDYNIKLWFNKTGHRCYGKDCSPPPSIPYGNWQCDKNNQTCEMKCDIGFATILSSIKCENGNWSESVNQVACSPSVYLTAAVGSASWDTMDSELKVGIYHPLNVDPKCANPLPPLDHYWTHHTIFTYHGTVYICGGWDSATKCISSNGQQKGWKVHSLDPARIVVSSIIMKDRVYLIGGSTEIYAVSSKLPLPDKPAWKPVPNLPYIGEYLGVQCVIKMDSSNFVITGGYYLNKNQNIADVTKYNIDYEKATILAPLNQARSWHGCVTVEKKGSRFIVVSGGAINQRNFDNHDVLQTTEIMDVDQNIWRNIGDLNIQRAGHGMILMERGIMVLGGKRCNYYWDCFLKSVELLDWDAEKWRLVEPSLTKARAWFGGLVEVPGSLFSCQLTKQPGNHCVQKCNTNKGCPLLPNNLLVTLSGLNKEFFISFDFFATEYVSGWKNVIQFTEGRSCCDINDRVPALWINETGKLHFGFAMDGDGNYGMTTKISYPEGQWHHVEFSQRLENNSYLYRVKINGRKVIDVENKQPKIFSHVGVFLSNNLYDDDSHKGSVRNLFINVEGPDRCKGTNMTGILSLSSNQLNNLFPASNCVDGNLDTFCQTKSEQYPYLVMKYPRELLVKEVKLITKSGDKVKHLIVSVRNNAPKSGELISGNLWRDDGRCGANYTAYTGEPGQCDPTANAIEKGPCCSSDGWCGYSRDHCDCESCVNYAGFKLYATCDNNMKIFADGNLLGTNYDWTTTTGVNIPPNTNSIEINCYDYGVVGGILASAINGLRTDGSWSCSADGGSTWNPAYEIGPNGMSPWGFRPYISEDAKWIWNGNNTYTDKHNNVSCQITLESGSWSGTQSKIWSDNECKNVGIYGSLDYSLKDCKKKCLETEKCTAINYNIVSKDCELRGCPQPVPSPQWQHGNYRGYYILDYRGYFQTVCGGKDSGCCTPDTPCGLGDGDCDSARDCKPGLVCGENNCSEKGIVNLDSNTWDRTDDCCTYPEPEQIGWCETSDLQDQNIGLVNLDSGSKEYCYFQCKAIRQATGCEWHITSNTCSVHTMDVTTGSGHNDYRCWIFKTSKTSKRGTLQGMSLKNAEDSIEDTTESVVILQDKIKKAKKTFGTIISMLPSEVAGFIPKVEMKLENGRQLLVNVQEMLKEMELNFGNHSLTCIKEAKTTIDKIVHSFTEAKQFLQEMLKLAGQLHLPAGSIESLLGPINIEMDTLVLKLDGSSKHLVKVEEHLMAMGLSAGPSCNAGLGPNTLAPPPTTVVTETSEEDYSILGTYAGPANDGQVLTFLSEAGLRGKYVVIQLGYTGELNLAEIEVRVETGTEIDSVCSTPPPKQNGKWSCNDDYSFCFLRCKPGFVAHLHSSTTCSGGIWKEINNMKCLASVFLLSGGSDEDYAEIYDPSLGHPTCADNLPPLDILPISFLYASFYFHNTIYLCGQTGTLSICFSFNSEINTWRSHTVREDGDLNGQALSIRFDDKIYLFGGHSKAYSTTLPLAEEPEWTHESILSYLNELPCVTKMDGRSLVITGGQRFGVDSNEVNWINVVDKTSTKLPSLPNSRYDHGCVLLEEEGKLWIIVAGGSNNDIRLDTAQKLDINERKWTQLGKLNEARTGLKMIVSEMGAMVMGGGGIKGTLKTVEFLNWTSSHWELVEPSLTTPRSHHVDVELPASLFSCETQAIKEEGCKGEYAYNVTYEGGNVVTKSVNQTCHTLCQSTEDCKTWTWTPQLNECRIQTSEKNKKIQVGSISGKKNTCKPKCFLVIGDEEHGKVNTNTQFCNFTNTIKRCWDIIQMEPNDFEVSSEILVCYEVEGESFCEPIAYEAVDLICNPEPGIVTLSTYQRINKHRFTTHNRPSFGKWG